MGYAEHFCALLRPLGVYDLSAGSLSGGELDAMAAAFDELYAKMQQDLSDALPLTAGAEGLAPYEALLGHPTANRSLQQRRDAVVSLLRLPQIGAALSALEALNAFSAELYFDESELPQRLTVTLDGDYESQQEGLEICRFLDRILPCHLAVSYVVS